MNGCYPIKGEAALFIRFQEAKMKTFFTGNRLFKSFAVAVLLIAATNLEAARSTYNTTLVNEAGLAYNNTYTLNTANLALDQISWQAVFSSTTFAASTFNDGTASTGSITVVSTTALHGLQGTDTLTVVSGKNGALAAAKATDSLLVSSNSVGALTGAYVNVNGKKLYQDVNWFLSPTAPNTAISIASAINANTNFTATTDGSSVTVTCAAVGIYCNAYTLSSSTQAALAVATAKFTGGQDPVNFKLNGRQLTNGVDWSTGQSSTNTAASIVTAAAGVNGFVATASSNVVTISCASSGTFCNAYTLTSSSAAALLAGAATFSGGVNAARLAINGTVLTEGVDWTAQTNASTTAKNISDAIVANSTLSSIISSSWTAAGVVTTTSTSVGTATNYTLWTSTNAALRPFAVAMRGGTNSAIQTASGSLHLVSHGFTTALPVLYKKTAGTSPGQLVANTTYYVVPVDANNLKLASTSTAAVAGTPVVGISTQTSTGGGSFSLTALAIAGTPSFKWQSSNDNTNWFDMAITTVTFASPYTASNQSWDFGTPNYVYYRLNVIGPTQGGMKLVVTGNGRSNSAYRP